MEEKIGTIPPFGLRMPKEIKQWVKSEAAKADRSQNYVIVKLLETKMSEMKKDEAA